MTELVTGCYCPKCGATVGASSPSGMLILCLRCPWQEMVVSIGDGLNSPDYDLNDEGIVENPEDVDN